MSIYQMSIMGGSAGGAALWRAVTAWTSVATSLVVSALLAVVLLTWTRRFTVETVAKEATGVRRQWLVKWTRRCRHLDAQGDTR